MGDSNVYVSGLGVFLPNEPVNNDQIETVLGHVNHKSTRVKKLILKQNGIETRYYAIDPVTRNPTHSNTQMTAAAIRSMAERSGFIVDDIECLACGTSGADQFIPNHASMVQAELQCPPCDAIATSGVCCSGMSAFKYGYMNVKTGQSHNAVVTGSELVSPSIRGENFQEKMTKDEADVERAPALAFENDFLRWMLSDGAGAFLITDVPRDGCTNLRIDWVDLLSFANESEICMFSGIERKDNGTAVSWRHVYEPAEQFRRRFFNLGQDVKVLQSRLPVLMKAAIGRIVKKRSLSPDEIDWLLPHYSSAFFRKPLYKGLEELNFEVPYERWFTNLSSKGNTGAASIYIMLEELISSGRAKPGDRILCIVPESARMTFAFLHLTML